MVGRIDIQLQQIMEAMGINQKELAQMTGIRAERISRICKGYVDRIEISHITKICDALQVTPSAWIIYDSDWMYKEDAEA